LAEETRKRKDDHIRICLDQKAQALRITTGFEDVQLVHSALPEIDKRMIDLTTSFLGHRFSAPVFVGAMTGGTPKSARINAAIAEAVEKLDLGMGVGSQRAALEDEKLAKTYAIARKKAPNAFLVANIGGVQLVHGYGPKEIKKIVEMIDADAVAIHLNALQEAIQPEGQTNFRGILAKIEEITHEIEQPVIAKETGSGIAAEDAKKLEAAGVKALDIGGAGGTSFAAVEYYRAGGEAKTNQSNLGKSFWDWGIPTVASLVETVKSVKIPVIASGGIRSGIDAAKALALHANLASVTQPVLEAAVKGSGEVERLLSLITEEIRNVMFLTGANKIEKLARVPVVVTGNTSEWLRKRGFEVAESARKGEKEEQ
jgi:isopentenyl-diphosphate delta-isomerase